MYRIPVLTLFKNVYTDGNTDNINTYPLDADANYIAAIYYRLRVIFRFWVSRVSSIVPNSGNVIK